MNRRISSVLLPVLTVLLTGISLVDADEIPQLGKSPVRDVVAAMTQEEKVRFVMGTGIKFPGLPPAMQRPAVGETSESVPGAAGNTFAIRRLGIPALVLADGPAGLRIHPERESEPSGTFNCTAFPIESLLASTWDVDLLERVGRAMGNEALEYGVDILLAPALNIHRNPLGGQNFEYYAEDPLVTGRMAAAFTKGVQSEGVGVSLKHYVANNHEWNRNVIDVKVSPRALREIYLRGFEIAVREARPWTVMSSYNRVNGTYTSENPELLQGVLRDDWDFDGLVMTDWFGGTDPVAQMIAGNDLLMPGTANQQKALLAALENGDLDEGVLDRNIERILQIVLRTPAFKGFEPSNAPDLKAHAAIARAAAAEGMVLLENAGALPLSVPAKIALLGNSSYQIITGGTGSGDVNEAYSISLLDGLRDAGLAVDAVLAERYIEHIKEQEANRPPSKPFMLPPPLAEMTLRSEDMARLAQDTDVALLTIGRRSGEFSDRSRVGDLELSADEKALIKTTHDAFKAAGTKLVIVLNIGGPIEIASWRENADAILLAWQPGQEAGHAITDVLTGKSPPSGKLATTFPLSWEDVPSSANFPGKTIPGPEPNAQWPFNGDRAAEVIYEDDIWVGYRHFATKNIGVAYPFGFGRSYTEFEYGEATITENANTIVISLTVKNSGAVSGREIVQLYVSAPGKTMPKPALELKGFAKTKALKPGESQTLSISLTSRDLASFDEASSAWITEEGTYTIRIGASSEDFRRTVTMKRNHDQTISAVSKMTARGALPVD